MALVRRKTDRPVLYGLVAALNATRRDATVVGTRFHSGSLVTNTSVSPFSVSATDVVIASTNASDLPSSLTLANELALTYGRHIADGTDVHKAADSTNTVTAATAIDLPTCITLANQVKAQFNAHIASTTFHYNADSTNTVATTNASDLASSIALLNALKTAVNAHMASHVAGFGLSLVDP